MLKGISLAGLLASGHLGTHSDKFGQDWVYFQGGI